MVLNNKARAHTALALVGAGLGATIVGRSTVENNRSDVSLMPIHDIDCGTSLVAVTRKDDDAKILGFFIDLLLKTANQKS